MDNYTFRPWREGDDLELLQLWGDAESSGYDSFRAMFRPDQDSGPWSRTLVAEHQGVAVAAATVYETSLHVQRLWAYIEVAVDHRRQGLGAELFRRLQELASSSPSGVQALRSKVQEGSAGASFAQAMGLGAIQRSQMVKVASGSVPEVPLRVDSSGQPMQVIENIATGSVELTQKMWEFYSRSHRWDPPAEISLGQVNRLFLSDEAEALGAIVLRDFDSSDDFSGKPPIKAFVVSYRPLEQELPGRQLADDEATEILLGYDFDDVSAREAIMQLLYVLVHQYPVILEVDESMEDLQVMINQLVKMGSAQVLDTTLVVAH
ncbi:GNAT family N-acetyltransferase [Rothia sp. CCM 9418]|uniref:GNAT family N-acetyltransferase n=1 Tax=unclassified Rothia (in: high G+C Gram-positive bacteria) TaxID=2689056 RepID=UPI003AD31DC9